MKKILIGIISASILFLNGCKMYWNYETMTEAINNKYFQSEIMWKDGECTIIRNSVTGEYFILISGAYGITMCPIEVNEDMKDFVIGK